MSLIIIVFSKDSLIMKTDSFSSPHFAWPVPPPPFPPPLPSHVYSYLTSGSAEFLQLPKQVFITTQKGWGQFNHGVNFSSERKH